MDSAVKAGVVRRLEAFAAGVAAIDVVPELDVGLVEFPAEEDFVAVAKVGEIEEAAFEVLDLDTHFLEATELVVELEHVHEQAGNLFATNFGARSLQRLTKFRVGFLDDIATAVQADASPAPEAPKLRLVRAA